MNDLDTMRSKLEKSTIHNNSMTENKSGWLLLFEEIEKLKNEEREKKMKRK